MAERNTTVNAGPPIDPAPSVGARVTVHACPFIDGEEGTVVMVSRITDHDYYTVALDSEPENPYGFWAGELEAA